MKLLLLSILPLCSTFQYTRSYYIQLKSRALTSPQMSLNNYNNYNFSDPIKTQKYIQMQNIECVQKLNKLYYDTYIEKKEKIEDCYIDYDNISNQCEKNKDIDDEYIGYYEHLIDKNISKNIYNLISNPYSDILHTIIVGVIYITVYIYLYSR